MPPSLFVFGTLRDPDVQALVLDRDAARVRSRVAFLADHRTVMLPDETYPVLAPSPGTRLRGLLLALDEADLRRVAFFEGDEYAFETATVSTGGGDPVAAILCAERLTRTGPRRPWSLSRWQREHKARFLEMSRDYMALYGERSAIEADRVWQTLTGQG